MHGSMEGVEKDLWAGNDVRNGMIWGGVCICQLYPLSYASEYQALIGLLSIPRLC